MANDAVTIGAGTGVPLQADVSPAPNLTFLRVKSNEMIEREENLRKQAEALRTQVAPASSLAQLIETRFRSAENAKRTMTEILLDARRRREGTYDAAHLAEIKKQGGSEIFMKVTEQKCNTVEALISSVILPEEGKPWMIEPTPKPDLPPQIVQGIVAATLQEFMDKGTLIPDEDITSFASRLGDESRAEILEEARKRAGRMETIIDDELLEGDFDEALDECINDLVTDGTMIMKGPFMELAQTLEWLEEDSFRPMVTELPKMKFRRVDPLKFFPSQGGTTPNNAQYLVEVMEFSRSQMNDKIGAPGYSDDRLRSVLGQNLAGTTIILDTTSEEQTLAGIDNVKDNPDEKFQGLIYSGEVTGRELLEWGLTGLDELESYEVVAFKLGNEVVKVMLNPDPLGRRNYMKAVYKPRKGSFWGKGVPHLMEDVQDGANATARHLINNVAIASGPQVVLNDTEALAEDTDITALYPWKIWQFTDARKKGGPPIGFPQPDMHADMLMKVFDWFVAQADERIGVPDLQSIVSGSRTVQTATALAMIMNSSARVLKKSIRNIGMHVINPLIHQVYSWNMLFLDDPSIKGDVRVKPSGALGLLVKEQQQLRLTEYASTTNNPTDMGIIGAPGRASVLRALAKELPMETSKVIPTEDEMEQRASAAREAAQQPPAAPQGAPALQLPPPQ